MKKILVVDDESDFRLLLLHLLQKSGYSTMEAADGQAAWELLSRERADLLVVDWNMPRMTGLELCRAVRQNKDIESLPIIMLTVRQQDNDYVEGLHHGADIYLTKPIEPEVILLRIKSLLRKK